MGPVEFHQGPPDANAEFVCQMEEVLNVSQRPYDLQRPVVCFDEGTKPLVKPVSPPILKAMLQIYGGLLHEIERRRFDVFSQHISLPRWRKLWIAAKAMLHQRWIG